MDSVVDDSSGRLADLAFVGLFGGGFDRYGDIIADSQDASGATSSPI
jgi:hypothetical protein